MAFSITLTDGTLLTTVEDGTINDTSCSLTLIGKNYVGYGTIYNDNLVHLLENSSSETAPTSPITGQLWWDKSGNLKVYTGSGTSQGFKTISTVTTANSAPSGAVTGSSWWDTVNQQLNVYNGSSWVLVGPAFAANVGTSGILVDTITDVANVSHIAVKIYVGSTLLAINSKDSEYTPFSPISGFITIKPGVNLINEAIIANVKFWGKASDADSLGGFSANDYVRTGGSLSGNILINGSIIATGTVTANNIVANLETTLSNTTINGNLTVTGNISGANIFGNILGNILGNVLGNVSGNISTTSNITTTANVIGSYFVGIATEAQYADLAERFESDQLYEPGTLVRIGGEKEITIENDDASPNVLGVISSNPAYLMNSNLADNIIAPPVALSGRVPVRVIGKVSKGDRLISAGNGIARASRVGEEVGSLHIFGKALENKYDDGIGMITAIVKFNV